MAATAKAATLESGTVSCSVCLEQVSDVGERSFAKLRCGHYFHLDCIGSAFNAKGSMQCPNCRRVEDGRWLYASGCRQHEEFTFPDLPSNDEVYDVYAGFEDAHELQVRHFQWCPYLLEEMDSPVPVYPDSNVVFNVLYGESHPTSATSATSAASAASGHHVCPFFSAAAADSYWTTAAAPAAPSPSPIADELVVVQNHQAEPGVMRFPVHDRSGWASHSAGSAHNPVGMVSDVGLASLPIERFRWSAPANRSDALQPTYSGQLRPPENNAAHSWHHVPCPYTGLGSGSSVANVSSVPAPVYVHGSGGGGGGGGGGRRSRAWVYGTPSSSSSNGSRAAPPRVASPYQADWQRRRDGGHQRVGAMGYESGIETPPAWRPWFQTGGGGGGGGGIGYGGGGGGGVEARAGSGSVRDGSGDFQGQHYYYSHQYDEVRRSSHHHHYHHHHAR